MAYCHFILNAQESAPHAILGPMPIIGQPQWRLWLCFSQTGSVFIMAGSPSTVYVVKKYFDPSSRADCSTRIGNVYTTVGWILND